MSFDLETHYELLPKDGLEGSVGRGKFHNVTCWKRKPSGPSDLPSRVAVKVVYQTLEAGVDARTLLSLRHENIVRIFHVDADGQRRLRIAMELCVGTLNNLLDHRKLDLNDLRFLGLQILSGLQYLHGRSIAHGDVKPHNIFVDDLLKRTPRIMLGVFSSWRRMGDSVEVAGVQGTVDYMAPELARAVMRGHKVARYNGQKADIFSAGITICRVITGTHGPSTQERLQSDFNVQNFLLSSGIRDSNCLSLLAGMLAWEAEKRVSAGQAARHTFFSGKIEWNEMKQEPLIIPRATIVSTSLAFYHRQRTIDRNVHEYRQKENTTSNMPPSIAVKEVLNVTDLSMIRELDIHSKLYHRNVIELYGHEMVETTLHIKRNVIELYGHEMVERTLHIKMELAKTDLSQLREKLGARKFLPAQVAYFASHIMKGLSYLHTFNVLHRDIKPQNILAQWEGETPPFLGQISQITLKLCDFGSSRWIPDRVGETVTVTGTKPFMAPEVAYAHYQSKKFNGDYKRSDVYSAGMVIYYLLFGSAAFSYAQLTQLEETVLPMPEHPGEGLVDVLRSAMCWKAGSRCDASDADYKLFGIGKEKPKRWIFTEPDPARDNPTEPGYLEERLDGSGTKPLHRAAEEGDIDGVARLLNAGDDVDKVTDKSWTPLHYAAQGGHIDVAALLVERSANVNLINKDHKTPLHLACKYGHLEVAELLIGRGASVNMSQGDEWTTTPLHLSCSEGYIDISRLLLQRGADKDAVDDDRNRPIYGTRKLDKELREQFATLLADVYTKAS